MRGRFLGEMEVNRTGPPIIVVHVEEHPVLLQEMGV